MKQNLSVPVINTANSAIIKRQRENVMESVGESHRERKTQREKEGRWRAIEGTHKCRNTARRVIVFSNSCTEVEKVHSLYLSNTMQRKAEVLC